MKDLIFFGMQGAGKGTLGRALAEKHNLQVFETGGELRRLAAEDSELGRKIKSIIESGNLVSNEVVMEIVENFLENQASASPIIFDGIPRSVHQAETLMALLEKHGREYIAVLIEIDRDTALKRLTTRRIDPVTKKVYPADYPHDVSEDGNKLETRKDDNPEAIEKRLELFAAETIPAMEMFKETIIINGENQIDKVFADAEKALEPLIK